MAEFCDTLLVGFRFKFRLRSADEQCGMDPTEYPPHRNGIVGLSLFR